MRFLPKAKSKTYEKEVFLYGSILTEKTTFDIEDNEAHTLRYSGYYTKAGVPVGQHTFYDRNDVCPKKTEVYDFTGNLIETILF